jgi:hypothetical protein
MDYVQCANQVFGVSTVNILARLINAFIAIKIPDIVVNVP